MVYHHTLVPGFVDQIDLDHRPKQVVADENELHVPHCVFQKYF